MLYNSSNWVFIPKWEITPKSVFFESGCEDFMQQIYYKKVIEKRNRAKSFYSVPEGFIAEAVFSDGTAEYRTPAEPKAFETVKIRLRIACNDAEEVFLHVNTEDGYTDYKMKVAYQKNNGMFDIYQAEVRLSDKQIKYYFDIRSFGKTYYYNRVGVSESHNTEENDFLITPGFSTPDWAKGAVFYQIYVDRFCNGDPNNDVLDDEYNYIGEHVKHVDTWERYPAAMDVREFYGGDLAGVLSKLDFLQKLGVEVIYLNPIFTSPSNHKYDVQDYDCIDPHYGVIAHRTGKVLAPGDKDNSHATSYIDAVTSEENKRLTDELFIKLVEEIHNRGMKIILDGVFNHCGSFNKWLDRERIYENCEDIPKGAYISKDSPYVNYFDFKKDDWPYNGDYDGWWGHNTLPKLNYEGSKELYDHIMSIGRKWVSAPYNCDGWRLDVAADLGHSEEFNHKFWAEFRKNVKAANPNAIILAEHYGDPYEWLRGDQWDTLMNYDAFMEPVTWFFTGMEKHSDEHLPQMMNNGQAFKRSLLYNMCRYQTSSLQVSMNELSNHDHSRFLTRTNHIIGRTATHGPELANKNVNKSVFMEAVVFQMTWPGAPTVYYGDEAGVCGWTDPDNRRTYPWGREDKMLLNFHRDVIAIHKAYDTLRVGSVKILTAGYGTFSFARMLKDEVFIVAFNNTHDEMLVHLPVWEAGVNTDVLMVSLFRTNCDGYDLVAKTYDNEKGYIELRMPGYSSVILKTIPRHIIVV
jgi:alpha-glucosidase